MSDQNANPTAPSESDAPTNAAGSAPVKTPMYQASNAARYQRQALLKEIEVRTGRTLICYVAGIEAPIDRDDAIGFVEILHNIKCGTDLELLLHTPGGDIDAAEKLINLLHATATEGRLRIIVPDFAKSAGTMMALGATKIVMSDVSELGPIDPQIKLDDGRGNRISHSILHYLDAYESHSAALRQNPNDTVAKIMLARLDPSTVKLLEGIRNRARNVAEEQMNRWMFQRKKAKYTEIAGKLMNVRLFPSHGQMIGWQDAQQLELEIEYLPSENELWRMYWQLYCLQRLAITDKGKLFESGYASHAVERA